MRGFTLASVIVLVIVVVVVALAAILLARTVQTAQAINAKAQRIAKNGRGINKSTDAVIQLTRTNDLATSILRSAQPLQGQLAGIVGTANRINGLAGSINATALRINSTAQSINTSAVNINSAATSINASAGSILNSAGTINNSAGSINNSAGTINQNARSIRSSATSIRRTASFIDTDVDLINRNLDVTLDLVAAIKRDTAVETNGILSQAIGARDTAACIDRKLFGPSGAYGDCGGRLNEASAKSATKENSKGATTGAGAALRLAAPAPTPAPAGVPPAGQGAAPPPDLGNTANQALGQVNQTVGAANQTLDQAVGNVKQTVGQLIPGASGG